MSRKLVHRSRRGPASQVSQPELVKPTQEHIDWFRQALKDIERKRTYRWYQHHEDDRSLLDGWIHMQEARGWR